MQELNDEQPSEEHHGAKPLPERLSAAKLQRHADSLAGFIGCAAWAETAPWQPFMQDVAALVDGMEKLAAAMVKKSAADRKARADPVPPRAPDREEDVEGSRPIEPCAPEAALERYDLLRARLAKLKDYELLLLDDALMGVNAASTVNVMSKARQAFREDLKLPGTGLYIHIYHSGGPRPHTVHVWKLPAEAALRSEAKQAAALAAVTVCAPRMASRQLMRDFYKQYAATELPEAVLRAMWDDLSGGQRERDKRDELIDNRVLQWMASTGETGEAVFWDQRELNGASGDKFDAFWDEMGAYLELEVGAGAHERRAATAEDVTYAAKIVSVPQLIRDVTERLHQKPGLEEAPTPAESTVRAQFMPNRPTAIASRHMTSTSSRTRNRASSARTTSATCPRPKRMRPRSCSPR